MKIAIWWYTSYSDIPINPYKLANGLMILIGSHILHMYCWGKKTVVWGKNDWGFA
jgi:hypothetical protein